ncbi:MAG: ribonuclease E/G, partial [Clostridia bacterium]|nr:ribonuclease E/G [Clostridia bacterium]
MQRKLYFDSQYGLETYALIEDGRITEYSAEPVATGAVIGNIYKGRVTNVLNGMQAAFVDCGLERHCYISVADLIPDKSRFDGGEVDIPLTLNLHEGDEIMVQVTKAAQGKKGAKVTTRLSFVGKYIVYMPDTPFVGVSAKIADPELRKNLMFSAKKQLKDSEGLIVRTAAPYAALSTKIVEINYFRTLYRHILNAFENAPVGELLYSDSPLHIRVLRDFMLKNGDEIFVGNERIYRSITELASSYAQPDSIKITLHDAHTDLFYSEGIYSQFVAALQP